MALKFSQNAAFNPVDKILSLDTETTGLNHWGRDEPFMFTCCDTQGNTYCKQWPVDPYTRKVTADDADLHFLSQYTEDPECEIEFFNAGFDKKMLRKMGVVFQCKVQDAGIRARVFNNLELNFRLKYLSKLYLGIEDNDEKDLKLAVQKARRIGKKLGFLLGKVAAEDYWLPHHLDQTNALAETYARLDAFRTMALRMFYLQQFEEDPIVAEGYRMEARGFSDTESMENRGIKVNPQAFMDQNNLAKQDAASVMDEMLEIIKNEQLDIGEVDRFNPSSHGQLARILFLPRGKGGLGLSFDKTLLGERLTTAAIKRKLAEGIGFMPKIDDYSTDKNALKGLAEAYNHDIIPKIIRYRASIQASALFFEKYLELAIPDTIEIGAMCLHPSFNQCGARTFRYSSTRPNSQQITNPRGSDSTVSYNARYAFEPRKGYVLIPGDYAQQELRIAASVGNIQSIIDMINAGLDPNSEFAQKAWGGKGNQAGYRAMSFALDLGRERPSSPEVAKAWEELGWNAEKAKKYNYYSPHAVEVAEAWLAKSDYNIVKAEKDLGRKNTRTRIKMVSFAKIYGGGWRAVIGILFVSAEEAKGYMSDLDRVLPEIDEWSKRLVKQAKRDGYIINPFGRKLRIDLNYAYKATNYMVQSSAACLLKNAMYGIRQFFLREKLDAHLILTIHDEIVCEISEKDATDDVLLEITKIMGDTGGCISVPMPVELKMCKDNWYDKVEWYYGVQKKKARLHFKGIV